MLAQALRDYPTWGHALAAALADRDELRDAATDLLDLLTYDQDPRNYNAIFLAAINRLAAALPAAEDA